ncbi:hypothetical protein AN639_04235 [Candidatus Epulonipiscium fishelsonii]|uniref:Uncharacterized protein n=1 Tax=Candidatus Epulonipiscium fishelsonii TaxID=77094 RepID=A0ACC8XFC2_9FIRM|nr:hypothetical protein AN639_04235 [Epulopiscium sp. SCG-B05WGA-EpuloA1]ONI42113.1 hypothetical protein AN396_02485 [Epulopiscium sp. SCG-B11WGA-EpuloA1]
MNAQELMNLISKNDFKKISVNYLKVIETLDFKGYSNVGDLFYFYSEDNTMGLTLDLQHYEEHKIECNTLEIKLNMIYQEKSIQMFSSKIGYFGQFTFAGMSNMMHKFHSLDAFEVLIDGKEYLLHESLMKLNRSGFAICDMNDIVEKILPMYTIYEAYSLDNTKLTFNTYGNMYRE